MLDKEDVFCAWPEQWQLKSHRKTKFPCTFQELKVRICVCNFDLHLCYNCTYIVYHIFSENCESWRRVWVGGSEDGYRYLIIISGLQIVEIFVCSLVQNTFGIAKKFDPVLQQHLHLFLWIVQICRTKSFSFSRHGFFPDQPIDWQTFWA